MNPDDPAYDGQKHYTPWLLKVYDPLVLGFFASAVWRSPARHLVEHYNRHIGQQHLDVGPGTGYFLEHARRPKGASLTLVDPNPNVLAHVSRRLAHLDVAAIEADICKPLMDRVGNRLFDSVALNLVFHCLPETCKAAAIAHIAAVVKPDGVFFGATVLGTPELHTHVSRIPLWAYNRVGAFDNRSDSEGLLREILGESFEATDLEVVGSIAIFSATGPRHFSS